MKLVQKLMRLLDVECEDAVEGSPGCPHEFCSPEKKYCQDVQREEVHRQELKLPHRQYLPQRVASNLMVHDDCLDKVAVGKAAEQL